MQKLFTRTYLAQHAPSLLRQIDRDKDLGIAFGSRDEKVMLEFFRSHGFPMETLEKRGWHFSVDDFGSVVLEVR